MLIKKISPTCLTQIRKKYNLTHVVMYAKSEDGQYVISNGDNPDNCVQAALLASRFRKFLGWPKMNFEIAPKLAEVLVENEKLRNENQNLKERLKSYEEKRDAK